MSVSIKRLLLAALATSLMLVSPATSVAKHNSVSPGCHTKSCAKRVCTSNRCQTRVLAKVRRKSAARLRSSISAADRAWLYKVRQCESGGNYSTDTGNGFYGAYQFDWGSWAGAGGSGNPAAAPPWEQDMRALIWRSKAGVRAWPVCG